MRRMMAQQAELAKARGETVEETETSQSEWSDDNEDMDGVANVPHDDHDRLPMNRDMSTSAVVTDVDDRGHDGDMDDTSMSSRGSPRLVNPKNEM